MQQAELERLNQLVNSDVKSRWTFLIASIFVCAAAGYISETAGLSVGLSEALAVSVGACVLAILALRYAAPRRKSGVDLDATSLANEHDLPPTFRLITEAVLDNLSHPVLTALLVKELASIINEDDPKRLRDEAGLSFEAALRNGVRLSPRLVRAVVLITGLDRSAKYWPVVVEVVSSLYLSHFNEKVRGKLPAITLDKAPPPQCKILHKKVKYHGGPINLEEVKFVNSSFNIKNNSDGRRLVRALLEAETGPVSVAIK